MFTEGFPCGSAGKEFACNVGELGWIPGLGRSPGEGNRYPPRYSSLENSMGCIVPGVTKSQTWLSDFHFHLYVFTNKQKRERRYHNTTTQGYYSEKAAWNLLLWRLFKHAKAERWVWCSVISPSLTFSMPVFLFSWPLPRFTYVHTCTHTRKQKRMSHHSETS